MGFLRKALFVGTGGLSGVAIKANSKKERTAKALEEQTRIMRAASGPNPAPNRPKKADRITVAILAKHKAEREAARTPSDCAAEGPAQKEVKHSVASPIGPTARLRRREGKDAVRAPASLADEGLAKLALLRDSGALSDEEFSAAKAHAIAEGDRPGAPVEPPIRPPGT